jgi:PAS domain S-box-containing protein
MMLQLLTSGVFKFVGSRLIQALRRPSLTLVVFSLAGISTIAALCAADLNSRYVAATVNAEHLTRGFAEVLAEHTARTFEAVDRTLQEAANIQQDFKDGHYTSNEAMNTALRHLRKGSPAILAIGWSDVTGNIQAHSYEGPPPRSNIADTPNFITHRDAADAGFFLNPPFRSSVTSKWITTVSRRLNNADGSFAGVVVALIDQSYFTRVYHSVPLGPRGTVTLLHRNGTIMTRSSPTDIVPGLVADGSSATVLQTSSSYDDASATDGVARIAGYAAVPGLPLLLRVDYLRSDALEAFNSHLLVIVPLVLLLILAILIGTFLLSMQARQLAQKTDLLEVTLENMDEGLVVMDAQGRVPVINRRACKFLDIPAHPAISQLCLQDTIRWPAGLGKFEQPAEQLHKGAMTGGDNVSIQECEHPGGTHLEVRTVSLASGGFVRTFTDMTQRRAAERAVRQSEQRYRILAENSTDMIFRVDLEFVSVYVSPASYEILGRTPDELIGTNQMDLIHPDDVNEVRKTYQSVIGGVTRASVTNRIRHHDGRWIWVEAELRLKRDVRSGQPAGIIGALRDISLRKQAETALRASEEKYRLSVKALRVETARVGQLARVKGDFLANMSHEIRTPLNGIIGYSGLALEDAALSEETRSHLTHVFDASSSLRVIVDDILDFSKFEAGNVQLNPAPFSVRELLDNCLSIVQPLATAKGLRLHREIEGAVPDRLNGDTQRLRQVLLNLLNNAVKFTDQGDVTLAIQCTPVSSSQVMVRFLVRDSGIGIIEHHHQKLFRRFAQADGSIARRFGGTGLGLAISKRFVELMGGTIGVESKPGAGSTFWASIPLPIAPAVVHIFTRASVNPHDEVSASNILVVDDTEMNRSLVKIILERAGHRIDVASCGETAVKLASEKSYDLILMDVQMPVMDGLEATRQIRNLDGDHCGVPILAMTANVLAEQVARYGAVGMDGCVGKPIDRKELLAVVRRWCHTGPQESGHHDQPALAGAR